MSAAKTHLQTDGGLRLLDVSYHLEEPGDVIPRLQAQAQQLLRACVLLCTCVLLVGVGLDGQITTEDGKALVL